MLRISRIDAGDAIILKLEGKLLEPWLEEVRAAEKSKHRVVPLRIDLSGVTFIDSAGIRLLTNMRKTGIELFAMSPFIEELLNLENDNVRKPE